MNNKKRSDLWKAVQKLFPDHEVLVSRTTNLCTRLDIVSTDRYASWLIPDEVAELYDVDTLAWMFESKVVEAYETEI